MTTFVVGAGSVHGGAAVCDYLDGRLEEGDAVHAAAWAAGPDAEAERDAADALNGVRSRLGVRAAVETHRIDGDGIAAGLRALADRVAADELVVAVGPAEGGIAPGDAAALLDGAGRPVAAVPLG